MLAGVGVLAQTPPSGGRPKFEVASVRENTADDGKVMFGIQPGGRFTAINVPVGSHSAGIWPPANTACRRARLDGNCAVRHRRQSRRRYPGAGPGAPPGPLNFMLQDLLEDRFKLRARRETREMPIYALAVARATESWARGFAYRPSTARRCAGEGRQGDRRRRPSDRRPR